MSHNATLLFAGIQLQLPVGVNPFFAISSVLTSSFYPPISRSMDYQVYALTGVFGM